MRACSGAKRKKKGKKRKKENVVLLRPAQPLFPLEDPGMTHSLLLCGDFVSVDVLASFADVNLGAYEQVGTHPSIPGIFRGTL